MSWQAYVDNLISSGRVDQAALYSKAGDSEWAKSSNFNASAQEMQTIAKSFDDPSELQASGIHINGKKYFLLRVTDRSIYGKLEETGIIIVKTGQALLVAHYNENTQPGEATKVVEQLADYLVSVGF